MCPRLLFRTRGNAAVARLDEQNRRRISQKVHNILAGLRGNVRPSEHDLCVAAYRVWVWLSRSERPNPSECDQVKASFLETITSQQRDRDVAKIDLSLLLNL